MENGISGYKTIKAIDGMTMREETAEALSLNNDSAVFCFIFPNAQPLILTLDSLRYLYVAWRGHLYSLASGALYYQGARFRIYA